MGSSGNPWCRERCAISSRAPGPRLEGHASRALAQLVDPRPQPSIDVRHEALTYYVWALVVAIGLMRRQCNLDGVQLVVRDARQQMSDAIEPGLFLVVGVHHVPRGYLSVGSGEHKVFCL